MKNSKLILLLIKFSLVLLMLLINSGCITSMLLDKAKGQSVSETHQDVINQVTAAYLTPNQDLIVCLHGLYEGKPPEQEYAFRLSPQTFIKEFAQEPFFLSKNFTVPRSQVVLGCPYANNELTGWRPVKVETILTTLTDNQLASLRPFPGTNETIYQQGEMNNKNSKRVIYTSNNSNLSNQGVVIELHTELVTTEKSNGNPFLYLLTPLSVAADVVTIPIIVVVAGTYLILCNATRQSSGERCELIHPG